ncbi:hypothetical protein L9F63_001523 [Diploptera punctata]|uniref:Uncharacterized protein n=1 Tax=Diploptera punctata TaxID=6984 RepID=A0AAD8A3U4_DIPPU|nr:hypothetical protein L9F63_001523 [Diploptera punctata]
MFSVSDNPSYFSLPGGSTSGIPASTSKKPFYLLKRRGANTNQNMGANSSSASASSSAYTSSSLINTGGNRNSCSAPTTPTTPEAASIPLLATPSPPAPVPFSTHSHNRRSFRSLLRSMSANSHHHHHHTGQGTALYQLQHQLLVLGEPRPSDMAPESPCLPHHPMSSTSSSPGKEEHHHRRNHSNKSIKSPKSSMELLNNDMVYCPVPDSHTPAPPQISASSNSEELLSESPEEVFLGHGDARYYNLTAAMTIPLPGSNGSNRRRHSIGTFLNKDRCSTGSITKVPTTTSVPVTPETEIPPNNDVLKKLSSSNSSTKIQDAVTSTVSVGSPEWRHPASVDIPRSTHSRRKCNRCCNTKGKKDRL